MVISQEEVRGLRIKSEAQLKSHGDSLIDSFVKNKFDTQKQFQNFFSVCMPMYVTDGGNGDQFWYCHCKNFAMAFTCQGVLAIEIHLGERTIPETSLHFNKKKKASLGRPKNINSGQIIKNFKIK